MTTKKKYNLNGNDIGLIDKMISRRLNEEKIILPKLTEEQARELQHEFMNEPPFHVMKKNDNKPWKRIFNTF